MIESVNIPDMRTIPQTAKLTGLAEHHVRQLVLTGKIVAVKAGKKYLININKLIEYLNTATIQPEKQPQSAGITPIKL
jgi:excisionase family DNA binding protein